MGVFAGDLDTALGQAKPAHAVSQARRTKTDLRQLQPVTFVHQKILGGDFHVFIDNFAVAAVLFGAHDRDAPVDAETRGILVVQERRQALTRIVRGAGDQDEMVAVLCAGYEPLAPAHHVFVADLLG